MGPASALLVDGQTASCVHGLLIGTGSDPTAARHRIGPEVMGVLEGTRLTPRAGLDNWCKH